MEEAYEDNSYEAACFALEVATMAKALGTEEEHQWALDAVLRIQTHQYSYRAMLITMYRLEEIFDRYVQAYQEMTDSLSLVYTESLPSGKRPICTIEVHSRAKKQPSSDMFIRMYSCVRARMLAMVSAERLAQIDTKAADDIKVKCLDPEQGRQRHTPFQDNPELAGAWNKAVNAYSSIDAPDDLDKALYGNIKKLAMEIGAGGSKDIKKMQELVGILERAVK
jgi:hypothetical protein